MSTKNIIECIERNHELMAAQVQKLTTITPELKFSQPATGGEITPPSVSSLLNATVLGHFNGVANAMRAMAEVESTFNSVTKLETGLTAKTAIIDVEATAIENKEGRS